MVENLVQVFCETQAYLWRGKFFRQEVGFPIGPRGTSGIARVVMNCFNRDGIRWGISMDLHIRYIDDVRVMMREMLLGARIRGCNR